LTEVEQNHAVIVSAKVTDQFGNPLANQDISLFTEHPSFTGPVLLTQKETDVHGTAMFEIVLRIPGSSVLQARLGNLLASSALSVQVIPSILSPSGPKSWFGISGSLSRLERDLSTVVGKMISNGLHPTKEELCKELGLDYDRANDRNRVSDALYNLKMWFDYVLKVLYQPSATFGKDFANLMNDASSYAAWKMDRDSPYGYLKAYYGQSEDEIRQLWVMSRMWDRFVQLANQYNLHMFVAYYDRDLRIWRYKQPTFWEYVDKQIQSGSRLAKGLGTILARHRDLGMILTSAAPVAGALEDLQKVQQMITERNPPKMRCLKCWRNGTIMEVSSQDELADHIKAVH
jgi:hypothetical protein